jgi:four helix bundle protein
MTIYQDKLQALEQRTVDFSVAVVTTCGKYSEKAVLKPLILQIVRSATSIDANYAEANNASSKTDFRSKIYIAKKEAGETRYWLRVLSKLLPDEDFSSLQQEALELNLIFQKILSTLNSGKSTNEK